jgi:hypothetical protein
MFPGPLAVTTVLATHCPYKYFQPKKGRMKKEQNYILRPVRKSAACEQSHFQQHSGRAKLTILHLL